jgi:hypothetical protein
MCCVATPLWAKCEDETHTPKSGNLESSRTPAISELNSKGQNTSPWGVYYIVGKVLKCRCPKWPCMSHLDICSPSYGQKKGRESLTTKSRESTSSGRLQKECDGALESSQGELKLWLRPHSNQRSEPGDMSVQSPGSSTRDSFETPPWESREKVPFGCGSCGVTQRILYGGRWWLPPSLGRGESSESKVARGLSQHQMDVEWVLTNLGLVLDAGSCNNIIVPLPSLILGLLACPSYPL